VPTLVVGERRLTQSLAILEYLEERHPLPPLLPQGAEDRAWVRSIALAVACDIHPLNNTRVIKHLDTVLGLSKEAREAWYAHWVTEGFAAIEPLLVANARGPFCHGDTPTLADVCLLPQVFNAQRFKVPLEPFPRIRAIHDACMAVPAFADAHPLKQPDAE
jgi:maleylpyruvate isomerase